MAEQLDLEDWLRENPETLTEQWKKGELERGFYYVYLKHLEMFDIAGSSTLSGILERGNENSIEVLAPVPSYEEWQELSKQRNQLIRDVKDLAYIQEENAQLRKFLEEFNALEVAKENQQLKELLSKCLDELAEFNNSYYPETQELFAQITNAIGEKK